MQVEATRLYRVKDVAHAMSVSAATVYRLAERGELESVRVGTAVRVPGAAITAYLAQAATRTDPEQVWANLTPAQADGLACVLCSADYLAVAAPHRPVGRSVTGSQVFACASHDGYTVPDQAA